MLSPLKKELILINISPSNRKLAVLIQKKPWNRDANHKIPTFSPLPARNRIIAKEIWKSVTLERLSLRQWTYSEKNEEFIWRTFQ